MSHQIVSEDVRSKAEVYYGDAVCQEKTKLLLKEVGLPNGLLPLQDINECGYVEETGFVWLKQKKKVEHTFSSIGRLVSYAAEITAFVEKGRIKKVSGVKAKELLLWVPLYEICVDDPPTGKLTCKSTAGITKTFPTSAFEVPEDPPAPALVPTPAAAEDKKDKEEKTDTAAAAAAAPQNKDKEGKKEKKEKADTAGAAATVTSKVAPVPVSVSTPEPAKQAEQVVVGNK